MNLILFFSDLKQFMIKIKEKRAFTALFLCDINNTKSRNPPTTQLYGRGMINYNMYSYLSFSNKLSSFIND